MGHVRPGRSEVRDCRGGAVAGVLAGRAFTEAVAEGGLDDRARPTVRQRHEPAVSAPSTPGPMLRPPYEPGPNGIEGDVGSNPEPVVLVRDGSA